MQQLLGQYLPHHCLQIVQDMSYGVHTRGVPAVPYIDRVQHLVRTTNRHPILSPPVADVVLHDCRHWNTGGTSRSCCRSASGGRPAAWRTHRRCRRSCRVCSSVWRPCRRRRSWPSGTPSQVCAALRLQAIVKLHGAVAALVPQRHMLHVAVRFRLFR